MEPIVTTAPLGDIVAGTYGVRIAPGKIYIGGAGERTTEDFRLLEASEIAELTHVLPFLFEDMVEEYRKENG
jgi:hypothetical protein